MNRKTTHDSVVFSISDLQREASQKLSTTVREYYNEGSMDLVTVKDNTAAYNRLRLRPRVCVDVSKVDASTECFGSRVAFPLGFSPAAMHKLAHEDGECGTSRAAAKFGVNMLLSQYATDSIRDVTAMGAGMGNAYGMQMCVTEDPATNTRIVRDAEAAGCKALVITVDAPALGRRLNEYRNNFHLPKHLTYPNMGADMDHSDVVTYDPRKAYDASLTWTKIRQIASTTTMDVYLKGVQTAEDALEAVRCGVAGIIVSNHGGRQVDSAVATIDALEEIVEAVQGRIQVHIDGGIRRGSDIFKALAMGADHCWVGRVPIWGLAYNGEEGVSLAIQLLYDEFATTMTLMGCAKISDIKRSHLSRMGPDGSFHKLQDLPDWSARKVAGPILDVHARL